MPLDAGDFCLISRRALDELNRLPEKDRYVRGLRAWVGFRQTGVPYDRDARQLGASKYSFFGLIRLAINGIVSFSDKPLVFLTVVGASVSALAFLYAAYLALVKIVSGGIITGYSSLMVAILFLSGIQLLALGVVGLYLSKIFNEVKARPELHRARDLRPAAAARGRRCCGLECLMPAAGELAAARERTRRHYDRHPFGFDQEEILEEKLERRVMGEAIRSHPLRLARLDVGCGASRVARLVRRATRARTLGIDLSLASLREARSSASRGGW